MSDVDSEYPLNRTKPEKPEKIQIWLTAEEKAEVQLIADLWNAFDKARDSKDGRKWERKSVLEQLVRNGIGRFWRQIGGKPPSAELRESTIKAAIARLEGQLRADKAKSKK